MPPLTPEMHKELRATEAILEKALISCCAGWDLFDEEAAFEYVRTYAIEFYDCFYGFYSQVPDPAYRRHWRPASERFAFQRILKCIDNCIPVQTFFNRGPGRISRIKRTISDHAQHKESAVSQKVPAAISMSASEDSISGQLTKLFEESRLTREYVAEKIGIDKRNVFRHLGGTIPRPRQIAAYEEFFTKRLNRPIKLKTS